MQVEDLNRLIGGRLRRRRKELGLKPSELAEALGVSFQQVQKYESGTFISAATPTTVGSGQVTEFGRRDRSPVAENPRCFPHWIGQRRSK